ncbi:MAG TPA: hypothetical protein VIN03_22305 [Roseateles sp.]
MYQFRTLAEYHDHWSLVLVCAPDDFFEEDWDPPGMTQQQRFEEAWALLRSGDHFAEKQLKNDARRLRIFHELLKMSREAFDAGDAKRGCHTMQEAEGLVWPSRAPRLKHVVEAEQRAFGEVLLYSHVVVTPYPCEGTEADLGDVQRRMWQHVAAEVDKLDPGSTASFLCWVMQRDGSIRAFKGRSRKATLESIRQGARDGSLLGAAVAELIPSKHLMSIDVEEPGRPRISIRGSDEKRYFHLEDARFFESDDGADARG